MGCKGLNRPLLYIIKKGMLKECLDQAPSFKYPNNCKEIKGYNLKIKIPFVTIREPQTRSQSLYSTSVSTVDPGRSSASPYSDWLPQKLIIRKNRQKSFSEWNFPTVHEEKTSKRTLKQNPK